MKELDAGKKLEREFEEQISAIKEADAVFFRGGSMIRSMVRTALEELIHIREGKIVLFDKKKIESALRKPEKTVTILCAMRKTTCDEMRKELEDVSSDMMVCDFWAIYYVWVTKYCKRECDPDIFAKTLLKTREGNVLYNVDSINTTFCNLNCVDCSNGVPYRGKKFHIPLKTQEDSLRTITNYIPICQCNIQGGEPLVNPEVTQSIAVISKNPNIAIISLATNGTIIPDEKCMLALKKSGAIIRISDYGKHSHKKDILKEEADRRFIPCDVYDRAVSWYKYGDLSPANRAREENETIARECFFGTHDFMVYNGKMYVCCRTLYLEACGIVNEAVQSNTIELIENFDEQKLSDAISGKYLYKMCDYCDYPMKEVPPAEQMTSKADKSDRLQRECGDA